MRLSCIRWKQLGGLAQIPHLAPGQRRRQFVVVASSLVGLSLVSSHKRAALPSSGALLESVWNPPLLAANNNGQLESDGHAALSTSRRARERGPAVKRGRVGTFDTTTTTTTTTTNRQQQQHLQIELASHLRRSHELSSAKYLQSVQCESGQLQVGALQLCAPLASKAAN
jgi:hypothetical protein